LFLLQNLFDVTIDTLEDLSLLKADVLVTKTVTICEDNAVLHFLPLLLLKLLAQGL